LEKHPQLSRVFLGYPGMFVEFLGKERGYTGPNNTVCKKNLKKSFRVV